VTNLIANWPAPANIKALTTQRGAGVSLAPYHSNNLAFHVADNIEHVKQNRQSLVDSLQLPAEPAWLEQTHSHDCVVVEEDSLRVADAAITRSRQQVLAIMTADCLPILLCNQQGTEIAAIHAGWRGLLNGIIDNTVDKMQSKSSDLMAWIGPAICRNCYETGHEVKEAFIQRYPYTHDAFHTCASSLYADLPKLAELVLQGLGIDAIYHSKICTFEQENTFYSYRRAAQTGRMATLIWFKQDNQV
jgi:YfiH family protein